ncbi:MAG: shikimate dehydrogenase [Bacteroidaceae bacterium]|nr:shikimate dehydrogenase [Bacteroidaceae bacterium]
MHEEYGLIGHPLGHSFSAAFFAQKFAAEGIDASYHNFDLTTIDEVENMLSTHPRLRGFNVTIPYKQAILPYLDTVSSEAQEIGAVNVVKVVYDKEGKRSLHGFNSDVVGFSRSIAPLLQPHHTKALVLGTGGASKAIVYGLKQQGISATLVSRHPSEGRITYADIDEQVLQAHTVIVNCSPIGMHPHVDEAPALPYELLSERHLCYDLVYNPAKTAFMQRSAARGACVKNGLEMLHLQALAAWEMWNKA